MKPDKSVIERIVNFIEYTAFVSNTEFANRVGIDPSNFWKMLKGEQTITINTLKKISAAYGLSLKWLATGEGEVYSPCGAAKVSDLKNSKDTRPRIPLTASAGFLTGFSDSVQAESCEYIPVVKAFPPYDYTMIVKGNSMEPKFEGGDEIALRKVEDTIEWGKSYVLDTRDGIILKRLYDAGENFRCASFNPEYPDFEVNKNEVFGVYKVVGLIRV
jgi:bacteriophage CI repressor helix-turn-helix domain|nr:MAG TPA: Repressor protein CI [Caudoviricetes sp.]